jgi:hypothetical protein
LPQALGDGARYHLTMNIRLLLLSGFVLGFAPAAKAADQGPSCREQLLNSPNDPGHVRQNFQTLGRCRRIISAALPSGMSSWTPDVCIGSYSYQGKKVYVSWGTVSGIENNGAHLDVDIAMEDLEGSRERQAQQSPDITVTLKQTASESAAAISLNDVTTYPPSNGDPNRAFSDTDVSLVFGKAQRRLDYTVSIQSTWPFPGGSWKKQTDLSLSCDPE